MGMCRRCILIDAFVIPAPFIYLVILFPTLSHPQRILYPALHMHISTSANAIPSPFLLAHSTSSSFSDSPSQFSFSIRTRKAEITIKNNRSPLKTRSPNRAGRHGAPKERVPAAAQRVRDFRNELRALTVKLPNPDGDAEAPNHDFAIRL